MKTITNTKTEKINTFLPIFDGFYGCPFTEGIEERELEFWAEDYPEIKEDIWEFVDYEEFHNSIAESFCDEIGAILMEMNLIESYNFESLHSPRFYNYSNDSVNVEFTINPINRIKILSYLKNNFAEFTEFIKDKYTPCSGFIPHYSNDAKEWYNEESLNHYHKLGQILNFILMNDGIQEADIFENIQCNGSYNFYINEKAIKEHIKELKTENNENSLQI